MAGAAELLERDAQLSELSALLETARSGEGRIALVYGEAGIGKTALLTQFTRLQGRNARLFWGACDPLSTPRPLAPLLDIAWTQAGQLAGRIAAGASREAIFQALFEELRSPKPSAIVVIEDLHWADDATLDLVKFLGRRAQRTTALLVLTWRDEGIRADHPLRASIGELPRQVVSRIPLRGLSPAAVESLGASAHRRTEGLHAATNGNPFFVTEVLASDAPGVPASVRDAVLARAARLPGLTRDLCELPSRMAPSSSGMSSPGRRSRTPCHRCAAATCTPASSRRCAPEVRIPHSSHGWSTTQPAPETPPPCYGSRPPPRSTPRGSARTVRPRHTCPWRCAMPAISFRIRAQSYSPHTLTNATSRTGWRTGSLRAPPRAVCGPAWLSRMAWYVARTDEAQRYADLAITALEGLLPGPELAMAWLTRAGLYASAHDCAAAIPFAEKALKLAGELGKPEIEANGLNVLAWAQIQAGEEAGWALMEQSLRLSLEHGLPDAAGSAYANLGTLAVEERRHELAAKVLDDGIAYASERDLRTRILCMYCWRARLRTETGRWAEAVDDAAHIVDHPGSSALFRLAALTPLGLLRARRGDPGGREALDEALALARENGELERMVPVAAARGELQWLSGDEPGAAAEASAVIEKARKARRPWYVADLAVWIWRGGGTPPPVDECARPVALQLQGDWRSAAAEFERLGCPYQAALACYESDDPDAILSALDALDKMEARPAAARLRRRLSELGVRGIPRGPRAARRGHPFDLTAREQEVLDALSLGLSNGEIAARLFVSPKTVDHHVSAILTKLDVRSRGAAVAKARRTALLETPEAPAK